MFEGKRVILASCIILNEKNEILLLKRHEGYYETPGGKVRPNDCINPKKTVRTDFLRAALRELHEELGENIKIKNPKFFARIAFKTLAGKNAVVYKFIMQYKSGRLRLCEPKTFEKFKWIKISELERYQMSPDMVKLIPKIRTI